MSAASDIKTFLDNLGTLGTIIVGTLSASPDEICAIKEYGGFSPIGQFGVTGIKYERPSCNLVFRGIPGDYSSPMEKARIAWEALAAVQPGELIDDSAIYLMISPQQSPFSLGQDLNLRYQIACNFLILKEK